MTSGIENLADYGFSILNFRNHLIFKFFKIKLLKSAIRISNVLTYAISMLEGVLIQL
jgi:hypothetical protein